MMQPEPKSKTQGLSIAGIVFACLSILLIIGHSPFFFLKGPSVFFSILALVFSMLAVSENRRQKETNKLALSSLSLSILAFCIALFFLINSSSGTHWFRITNSNNTEKDELIEDFEGKFKINSDNFSIEIKKNTEDSDYNKNNDENEKKDKMKYGEDIQEFIDEFER